MHIPQVAGHVHHLVVADQAVHAAATTLRLLRQAGDVFDDLERIRAAVRQVADLHKVGGAARPLALLVHQPGGAQGGHVVIVISVDIAHCHDALDAFPLVIVDLPGIRQHGDRKETK